MKKNCPPHPGFIWDVCIRCGMHKPADDSNGEDGVALRYIHQVRLGFFLYCQELYSKLSI